MRCPECGGAMYYRGNNSMQLVYRGRSMAVTRPAWFCARCLEKVNEPADLRDVEDELVAFKIKVDRELSLPLYRKEKEEEDA
jgi:YgiT-type zinc finger domain-containing protein